MTLLADRDTLQDYERELVDGFFFDGRSETTTEDVKDHYQKTGFDPTGKIRPGLEARAAELVGPSTRHWWLPLWLPTLLAFAAGVYLLWTAPGADTRIPRIFCVVVPAFLLAGFGTTAASSWRGRVDRGLAGMVWFLIPGGLLIGAAVLAVTGFGGVPVLSGLIRDAGGFTYEVRMAIALVALAFFNSIVNNARSRERAQGIALRKRLTSARRFFEDQLGRPQPALRDEWFPYVLAFGLDDDAQRWFRSYGGQSTSVVTSPSWSQPSSSSGSSSGGSSWSAGPSGWTGGGGTFGGAGASGSWALAASSLSAGVSAPSSSGGSSGGGGGGGSSSSGGGGGGGW